jgi:hypothetical protein
MRAHRAVEALLALACSAAAAIFFTYPLAFRIGHVGRINNDDGRKSIWAVSWIARTLVADPGNLFNANIFYPHRNTLAYSEHNIAAGLIGVPVYWATQNPYLTHNLVVLVAFTSSAAGMYYLAKYLTGERLAGVVSAIAFAFCPYIYARTPHIHLLLTAGLPFSMLALHALVDRPTVARGLALAAALIATGLMSGYYGIFAGLIVSVGVLLYAVTRKLWRNRGYWIAVGVAAAVTLSAMGLLFLPYRRLQMETGFARSLADALPYSADWRAYLASATYAHRWMLPLIGRWKEVLFPGFVAAICGIAGALIAGRRQACRDTAALYVALGLIAFWLSFGPNGGLYAFMYRVVPVFSLIRAPARFGIIVTFALSALSAFAVAHLIRSRPHGRRLVAALAILAAAELTVIPLDWREVEPIAPPYRTLATLPPGPVVELPFWYLRQDFPRHAYYMLNSTSHWQPLINGYSDYIPRDFRDNVLTISTFPSREAFAVLEKMGARYVIFHRNFYAHQMIPRILTALEEFQAYLRPLAKDDNVWLYEIVAWPK